MNRELEALLAAEPPLATIHAALPDAFVVGTAGHIDHGKTSLVRALTGVELDRLPEEQRRGITIALGFTTLTLASGRIASFIDVPGHERLVRTMIAGASGVDAVVLCVSAVEGVMPQTREHLGILSLLGVKTGLVALTMADLVDEELLELALDDVRGAVAGTFLADAPVIPTSIHDGRGLDALRAALDALPVSPRPQGGPFRLPVDRVFVQRGFGAVVTGTALSGEVHEGDELRVLPEGEREGVKVRVRGVQVHGHKVGHSRAGQRTALNLSGVSQEQLGRGAVVVGAGVSPASILDASVRWLPDAEPLEEGARLRLLLATAEVMAVVEPYGEPIEGGEEGLAQLRLAEPVVALPGDRFILRRESPVTTLGGGVVLDPWAPRARRRDHPEAIAALTRLQAGDKAVLLERAGPSGLPVAEAARRLGHAPAHRLGDRAFAPGWLEAHRDALIRHLEEHHQQLPLSRGPSRRALRRGLLLALEPATFDALVERAVAAGEVLLDGPRLQRPGFAPRLTGEELTAWNTLLARLSAAGLASVEARELTEGLPRGEALLNLCFEEGRVETLDGRPTDKAALDALAAQVRQVLAEEGQLTPTRFKELTGLSRKHAIPLLEWLDAQRITRRAGEVRLPFAG